MVNSSHPMNGVAAALVLLISPIPLLLGIVGSLAETGPMRIVFVAMLLSGAAMLYGGVQMLVKWRRAVAVEEAHQRSMRATVGPTPPPGAVAPRPATIPDSATVLAHWTYAADEWRAYADAELKRRTIEAVVLGVAIFLVGILIGGRSDDGVYLSAAALVGGMLLVGGIYRARSAYRANTAGPGEAIITPTAVLLNGRYHVLSNDTYRFEGVAYDPPVLEFRVGWGTRSGRTSERVRVPVPRGREDEARELVAAFERGGAPASA